MKFPSAIIVCVLKSGFGFKSVLSEYAASKLLHLVLLGS